MLYSRMILKDIKKWLKRDEIIVLVGPRQSGKTSLMKLMENDLKKEEKTFFFTLEDMEILSLLNETPKNIFKLIPNTESKIFVLLDEIQYLKNPSNFLKYIYDLYKEKIKLIVSGSSAFYIDKKFRDSLAGRKKIFTILPLNFQDFLIFKGREELIEKTEEIFSLNPSDTSLTFPEKKIIAELINEFATFGSYPKVVLEKDPQIKKELLKELVNSYIKKDINESEISYPEKFLNLLKILSYRIGNLLNKNELSSLIGFSTTTISNYLYIMEKSFHLKLIPPFFSNTKKEISKMPKIFFFDLGLRNYLLNNFSPLQSREDRGSVFENLVFKFLIDSYENDIIRFWKKQSGTEVDFVIPSEKKAFEVKLNKKLFRRKQILSFLNHNKDFSVYLCYLNNDGIIQTELLQIKENT